QGRAQVQGGLRRALPAAGVLGGARPGGRRVPEPAVAGDPAAGDRDPVGKPRPDEKSPGALAPGLSGRRGPGGPLRDEHFTDATMYSTADRASASVSLALPPRGGIARRPSIECFTSVSMPAATPSVQAALSPYLGAPATPAAWQPLPVLSYTLLQSTDAAGPAAARAAPA